MRSRRGRGEGGRRGGGGTGRGVGYARGGVGGRRRSDVGGRAVQVCERDDYQQHRDAQRRDQVEQRHLFEREQYDDNGDGGDAQQDRVAASPAARALRGGPGHVSTHHSLSRKKISAADETVNLPHARGARPTAATSLGAQKERPTTTASLSERFAETRGVSR